MGSWIVLSGWVVFVRGTSTGCVLGLSGVVTTITASDSVSIRAPSVVTSGVWDPSVFKDVDNSSSTFLSLSPPDKILVMEEFV